MFLFLFLPTFSPCLEETIPLLPPLLVWPPNRCLQFGIYMICHHRLSVRYVRSHHPTSPHHPCLPPSRVYSSRVLGGRSRHHHLSWQPKILLYPHRRYQVLVHHAAHYYQRCSTQWGSSSRVKYSLGTLGAGSGTLLLEQSDREACSMEKSTASAVLDLLLFRWHVGSWNFRVSLPSPLLDCWLSWHLVPLRGFFKVLLLFTGANAVIFFCRLGDISDARCSYHNDMTINSRLVIIVRAQVLQLFLFSSDSRLLRVANLLLDR